MANMEHFPSQEPENTPSSFEALLALLEFPQSPELIGARQAILKLLKDPSADPTDLQTAWEHFADEVELLVENPELDQHMHIKLQIGAIVHKALIFKEAGNQLRYAQELDDAESYAFNARLFEISNPLTAELDAIAETLPQDIPEIIVLKLRGMITDDDRLTLSESIDDGDDFDDVLGSAYILLDENGRDPDLTLKNVGLIE